MSKDEQGLNWKLEEDLEDLAVTIVTAKFLPCNHILGVQIRRDYVVIIKISQCTWAASRKIHSEYNVTTKISHYNQTLSGQFHIHLKEIAKNSQSLLETVKLRPKLKMERKLSKLVGIFLRGLGMESHDT